MYFLRNKTGEERLKRLAKSIEALAEKDTRRIQEALEIAEWRLQAASELHATCARFVASLNRLLPKPMVELSPQEFQREAFQDPGPNVFQINVAGRMIHIEFRATDTPTSTEKYRTPYVLEGAARFVNQDLLDHVVVLERLLFYCVEQQRRGWLIFDPRTHRTVLFDEEQLIRFMEQLV